MTNQNVAYVSKDTIYLRSLELTQFQSTLVSQLYQPWDVMILLKPLITLVSMDQNILMMEPMLISLWNAWNVLLHLPKLLPWTYPKLLNRLFWRLIVCWNSEFQIVRSRKPHIIVPIPMYKLYTKLVPNALMDIT